MHRAELVGRGEQHLDGNFGPAGEWADVSDDKVVQPDVGVEDCQHTGPTVGLLLRGGDGGGPGGVRSELCLRYGVKPQDNLGAVIVQIVNAFLRGGWGREGGSGWSWGCGNCLEIKKKSFSPPAEDVRVQYMTVNMVKSI